MLPGIVVMPLRRFADEIVSSCCECLQMVRMPGDDSAIVPRLINGRMDDPRCGKLWDWFYPPHK
jgi:hypothetical protein